MKRNAGAKREERWNAACAMSKIPYARRFSSTANRASPDQLLPDRLLIASSNVTISLANGTRILILPIRPVIAVFNDGSVRV